MVAPPSPPYFAAAQQCICMLSLVCNTSWPPPIQHGALFHGLMWAGCCLIQRIYHLKGIGPCCNNWAAIVHELAAHSCLLASCRQCLCTNSISECFDVSVQTGTPWLFAGKTSSICTLSKISSTFSYTSLLRFIVRCYTVLLHSFAQTNAW